jgi:hypothetical protein
MTSAADRMRIRAVTKAVFASYMARFASCQ